MVEINIGRNKYLIIRLPFIRTSKLIMKLSIGSMQRKRTRTNYLPVQNRTQNMAVVLNTMTSQIDVIVSAFVNRYLDKLRHCHSFLQFDIKTCFAITCSYKHRSGKTR